jgi:hypothetical protein
MGEDRLSTLEKYYCGWREVSERNQCGRKKKFKVLETKSEIPFEHILISRLLIHTY